MAVEFATRAVTEFSRNGFGITHGTLKNQSFY